MKFTAVSDQYHPATDALCLISKAIMKFAKLQSVGELWLYLYSYGCIFWIRRDHDVDARGILVLTFGGRFLVNHRFDTVSEKNVSQVVHFEIGIFLTYAVRFCFEKQITDFTVFGTTKYIKNCITIIWNMWFTVTTEEYWTFLKIFWFNSAVCV